MLNHVNTVLIGSNCPASYTNVAALSVGDVALFNENKKNKGGRLKCYKLNFIPI